MFKALEDRPPSERADFVFILNPKPTDMSNHNNSFYFAHWHYHSRGGGRIDFVSADQTAYERIDSPVNRDKFLTFCETETALLWFYLYLTEQLDSMRLTKPNLWEYAHASRQRLEVRPETRFPAQADSAGQP